MNDLLESPEQGGDEEQALYATWVTRVPVGTTFSTLGLLGNIVSLIVWDRVEQKKNVSGSSILYFKLLAVVNSCFLVSYFSTDSLPSLFPSLLHSHLFLSLYSYCLSPLFYYFNYVTIWTMFAINIERFLICTRNVKPSILTRKVFLVVVYMFGLVLNIPNVFTFRPDLDKTANESIWVLQETEFSKSQANYEYKFWIHCFLICILPLAVMIVLNVRIAKSIRESFSLIEKHLSGISTRTRQDRQIHLTLFLVTAFFLLLLLWECIATCLWFRGFRHSDHSGWTKVNISFAVGKLAIVFHCSLNIAFYFMTGSAFRSELYLLFSKKSSPRHSKNTCVTPLGTSTVSCPT